MSKPEQDRFVRRLRDLHSASAKKDPSLSGQTNLANKLTKRLKKRDGSGKKIPQGLISQYLNGDCRPAPDVLIALSGLFGITPSLLLQELLVVDYLEAWIAAGSREEELEQIESRANAVWDFLNAGVDLLSARIDSSGSESSRLRALAKFTRQQFLLDMPGVIDWERSLLNADPKLECFWIAHTRFRDDTDLFYDTVRANVAGGAKYVYFIRKEDTGAGSRFEAFRNRLQTDIGYNVDDLVVAVPFNRRETQILAADFVVAHPRKPHAVGFQSLWEGQPAENIFCLRLPFELLRDRVEALVAHVIGPPKNIPLAQLFPVSDTGDTLEYLAND